jgi:hypothetical protein
MFAPEHKRELLTWLLPVTLGTADTMAVAEALMGELRRRKILAPGPSVIERLVAASSMLAERQIARQLTRDLLPAQAKALEELLTIKEGTSMSALAWTRQPPGVPGHRALARLIEQRAILNAIASIRPAPKASIPNACASSRARGPGSPPSICGRCRPCAAARSWSRPATDGMLLEREHVYLIPPGAYLSIRDGVLRLSQPRERHGSRLPFDFFLHSLAEEFGERAICVILSGTGSDGSLGLKAIKERGGLVVAQDPDDAEYDGMPRSAMMTGAVDLVLPVGKISEMLAKYGRRMVLNGERKGPASDDHSTDRLAEIINLVRTKTSHDFALYKPGTLLRRIERRMVLAGVDDSGRQTLRLLGATCARAPALRPEARRCGDDDQPSRGAPSWLEA